MPKYKVEITETLQYQEEIEANNREEAIQKMKEKYRNEEIVLDDSHHVDTEFHVIGKSRKLGEMFR